VHVRAEGDTLQVSIGQLHSPAGYFTEPNAIRVELDPGSGQVIQFHVSPAGVDSLTFSGFVFQRKR
jgi:hypothetical protein